jgi:hypothetical protein
MIWPAFPTVPAALELFIGSMLPPLPPSPPQAPPPPPEGTPTNEKPKKTERSLRHESSGKEDKSMV